MSAYLVPDSIVPETGWRTWKIGSDGLLQSPSYKQTWIPGEPAAATCKSSAPPKKSWQVLPSAQAIESGDLMACDWRPSHYDEDGDSLWGGDGVPRPPRTVLPSGNCAYTYSNIEPSGHAAPAEGCTCGIYTAHSPSGCAGHGKFVLGRVNLWGKVVPGEQGARGEFAYPAELFILANEIANNQSLWLSLSMVPDEKKPSDDQIAGLAAYGVPVVRVKDAAAALSRARTPA